MPKESPAPDSDEELNVIEALEDVACAFNTHDNAVGVNCGEDRESERTKLLKEQAVAIFREIFTMLLGEVTEPESDNPTDEMITALGLTAFKKESFIRETFDPNREELIPLLRTLAEIKAEINADNDRINTITEGQLPPLGLTAEIAP